ncbi:unnamed protein product [Vitrella brassicaformis CCMP3155]|uniref:TLDc domain-containing protein n=1 Tax=Vitrella brassicaformis (strain CCMP3155) TaxID=1169540 RepID=A0A0G4FQQ7_VITBC|nr:unnamed protein product [Vitrella brassicaformis CCMP3155]|eukprot:CEM16786.1 unnamed protein product [Vitrella brassicaformis CCMP3155]
MKMTDKKIAVAPSLLYKSSRDTFGYPSFLNKVTGKSGLLFALRDGDTHRFGAFMDGQITPPADPTQTNLYKVPVFLYALSGAYDAPTKIEIPKDMQQVEVAGTQGAVTDNKGEPHGNLCIGYGYLWLGFARPGPAADLSRCQQWIDKDHLPEGYKGRQTGQGHGTLAQSMDFTCDEMEIYNIYIYNMAGEERLNRSDSPHRQRPREGGMCIRRAEEHCCSSMDGRSV